MFQLEDKQQQLIKLVSGDLMFVRMMMKRREAKLKHVSAAGAAERKADASRA